MNGPLIAILATLATLSIILGGVSLTWPDRGPDNKNAQDRRHVGGRGQ